MPAGEALIATCRAKGPFDPRKVRGRGAWREGARVVRNFGQPVESTEFIYLCFEKIDLPLVPPGIHSAKLHDH
jgi:hypothetical protein